MRRKAEERHIVKDYYSGNTHIQVADDYYRDKTEEDIERILKQVAEIVQRAFYLASATESEAAKEQKEET